MQSSSSRWYDWGTGILIGLVTAGVFLPTLNNDFVDWDDVQNFLENPNYRGLGWPQLRWMWSTAHLGHYVPLTWMTLGLDYVLWGMDPSGYHLSNLLLHAANGILVYFFARRLLGAALPRLPAAGVALRLGSAFAALLFAVHPLRVESVAWVTERRDVLCGAFFLLAVLAYLRYCEHTAEGDRSGRKWYWASVAAGGLALLSKSMAVSLPVVLLVLDVYPLRRLRGREVWIEKVPFVLLSLAASVVAMVAAISAGAANSLARIGLGGRVAVSLYSLTFYLWKTLIPRDLSPLYELPFRVNPLAHSFVVAGLTTIAATTVAVLQRRQWPALAAAWAAYVVILLPVLGIVHNGPQLAADRYSYLSCLGWALLAGGGLAYGWHAIGGRGDTVLRTALTGLAAAIVVALGVLTWGQIPVWRDTDTLWSHALAVSPSARANVNVGMMLARQGRLTDGVDQVEQALLRNPSFLNAYIAMGTLLTQQGRGKEALEYFAIALKIDPHSAEAHTNLGLALEDQGRLAEAIVQYRAALESRPGFTVADENLQRALRAAGNRQR
jgi:cytochrome c-type biogenesis protein CcmH/NrfG